MAVKQDAVEEIRRTRPKLETKREWGHGDGGLGADCPKANDPIYTDPGKVPDECHGFDRVGWRSCDNREWRSRSIVQRDAESGRVLVRDGKIVHPGFEPNHQKV